ncbi:MAG: hypothetical protein U0165_00385 [Polyangiaceae bacterium]
MWLARKLPVNARIEFDAVSKVKDGDLKVEVWGDGVSGATGTSYNNATSYLAILGGWKNPLHVLARLDEHGADRRLLEVDPKSDDERQRPVTMGQMYHFKIRANRWSHGLVGCERRWYARDCRSGAAGRPRSSTTWASTTGMPSCVSTI